ncbi:glycosyltransferase family 4 protein [Ktedonospora formicarum]|uniref:Glycosyl transferase family 1 n=1 Tax=Ktedonospora formicarum TaxID=2778364 RepID=A0A8J3I5T8_9CHLR|nr:glycosyltransferase family 4 protein [Ktedonospora formicarum]GHO50129.1 glycosyl transferase family 1 [Ktedonospora formicarum]
MRILVLTQVVVYPADAGPKVKTLQVLRHLAKHHDVTYCTFIRSEREAQEASVLRTFCKRVEMLPIKRSKLSDARFLMESLLVNDSFILRRDERSDMKALVRRLLSEEQIDVLHVDQLNMMRFVPDDWQGTVVLDEHNAVWQVVERLRRGARNPLARLLLKREVRLMRRLEGEECRRADVVLAVSEEDKMALREVGGETLPVEVVPITVDAQHFASLYATRAPLPMHILTIGTLFWPPNSEGILWWLRDGFPRLRTLCPEAAYDIVGARPPRALQALAEQLDGVQMHGYVADAEPFWREASVLMVPLLSGGGVRVKILEAMAMGVPVVSTTVGCEGLAIRDGEHLLIADTPQDLAQACARVLQDRELERTLAHNARELILERYDVTSALRVLDDIYGRIGKQEQEEQTQGISH